MKTALARATIALLLGLAASVAHGQLYINEIYLDPPGDLDSTAEYIELRGAPNASLADHYLIFLENEDDATHTGATGKIDHIFDFNQAIFPADAIGNTSAKLGTNGFLTLRQKNNPFSSPAPGTANLVNAATGYYSSGWGDASSGLGNTTVGASQQKQSGILENSGFTAFLIHNNGGVSPVLNQDLDQGNNGLDALPSGWSIIDQIGFHSEDNETPYGRLYATTNYGPGPNANIEPGATYTNVKAQVGSYFDEIEYVGRWGSRNTNTSDDWHVSNLTNDARSGYVGPADFRQSAEPHQSVYVQSNQDVPYGTILTNSLGRPNYPIPDGDLNQDGFVGQTDLSIVLSNWGQTDLSQLGYWGFGDSSGDGFVGQSDLSTVLLHWAEGQMIGGGVAGPDFAGFDTQGLDLSALQGSSWAQTAPEPGSLALLLAAGLFGVLCYRNQQRRACKTG